MTDTKTSPDARPISINVAVEIPARRIADMFVNAFEGNFMTRAWCGGVRFRRVVIDGALIEKENGVWKKIGNTEATSLKSPWYDDERIWGSVDFAIDVYEIIDESEDFDLNENEDNLKRHRVTRTELENGLKLMASMHIHHFSDFMGENDDAVTADVFLQLVALKEVVYG